MDIYTVACCRSQQGASFENVTNSPCQSCVWLPAWLGSALFNLMRLRSTSVKNPLAVEQAVGCLVEQQASLDGQDQLWWPWCCQSTTQTCLVASGAKEREVASLAWASKPVQNAKHLRNIAIHVVVLSIGVSITMLMLQYRRSCIVLLIDLFLGWKLDVAGP